MEYIMLESLYISKSKIRRDLLALFFTNPSRKYYLRELERILDFSAGSIRRELLKFQEDNLFLTQRAANLLYYSINTEHPLYTELKSMVSKTVGIEGSLRRIISSLDKISAAFIYGSFASKQQKASSDIDLMIIGDPDISLLYTKIARAEKKLNREMNVTVYTLDEFQSKKKEGRAFVVDLLTSPKIMLVGSKDDL